MIRPALGTVPGVEFRPLDVDRADDVDAAFTVVSECELTGLGRTDATRESVSALVTGPDALRGAQMIAMRGTDPVGLLTAEIDRHAREIVVDTFATGADAVLVQRELLARGIDEAGKVAAADTCPERWQVMSAAYEQDDVHRTILEELGLRPARRFWQMVRDVGGLAVAEPVPPSGVTKAVARNPRDRRLLHALFRESFAGHFGSSYNRPFEEWIATVENGAGADPARWWLAYHGDEPVGLCLLDDSKAEFGEGHIQTLGVIPAARGKGIARWLLDCAAADAAAREFTALALTVDGENTSGATDLYLAAGFLIRQVIDVWCYPLPASDASR